MNNLKVFKNQEFGSIRTVEIDGEPWFVAKDISDALEYSKTNKMLNRLDEDEKIHLSKSELQGHQIGGAEINNFGMRLINESGFYNAVIGSNKVEAKKFKKWVTKEVLPSIRKHGAYMTGNVVDMIYNDPQSMIDLLIKLKDEKEARVEAERRNNILMHTNKTYTATEIAKELGFKSATALNKDLCDKGIQYKVNNTYVLYSDYANLGYVSIKQQILDNGKEIYNRHFTQDGRDFILNLYNMQYRVN